MTQVTTSVTHAQALRMLAQAQMRPFTQMDWYGFAGCESKDPMLGECDGHVVLLDGETLLIIHPDDDGEGCAFKLASANQLSSSGLQIVRDALTKSGYDHDGILSAKYDGKNCHGSDIYRITFRDDDNKRTNGTVYVDANGKGEF